MSFVMSSSLVRAILFFTVFLFFSCANNKEHLYVVKRAETILLHPSQVLNESALGEAGLLLDEQPFFSLDTMVLDEISAPHTWKPAKETWYYPASAFIDLGTEYHLTGIYLYDGEGSGQVTISVGKPFGWKKKWKDSMEQEDQWNHHAMDDTSRYVRIVLSTPTAPGEIILTGKRIGLPVPTVVDQGAPPILPTMDQLMGVNAFVDDPLQELTCVSKVREYHNWHWDEGNQHPFGPGDDGSYPRYPNNKNKFQPSYAGNNQWFFDDFYRQAYSKGLSVSPVFTGGVDWLTDGTSHKPVAKGADPRKPSSYLAHADHLYQFAARYGSSQIDSNALKLAEGQPGKSGLGLLQYLENWNEQDAWWDGRAGYFTPYEFAAMTSMDYDGHMQIYGNRLGVKNADRQMKLVMGGLAYLNLDYLKAMKIWSDYHRKGSLPFDVFNLHHYSNVNVMENTRAISPEEDSLKEKIEKFVQYRNLNFPRKEVWVTEFGYDTHPESVQGVPEIGSCSREEVQAQWIVRSYLALAAAGVDGAFLYMFRDVDSQEKTKYATSGLIQDVTHQRQKKASWYYVNALHTNLKGYYFFEAKKMKGALVYSFKKTDGTSVALAIWLPSSEGNVLRDFKIQRPRNFTGARVVSFQKGHPEGMVKHMPAETDLLPLEVSESPTLVIFTK